MLLSHLRLSKSIATFFIFDLKSGACLVLPRSVNTNTSHQIVQTRNIGIFLNASLFLTPVFSVTGNFMRQLDWAKGWLDIWSNIIPGVSMRAFLEEFNICIARASKADFPP